MNLTRIVLAASLVATSFSAQADWWGSPSGRSANPANNPQLSVEGSFSTSGDYQNIGARVNYSVNEELTIYGDFSLAEFAGPDGNAFGIGAFYYLPTLSDSIAFLGDKDVAVQASYHRSSLDGNFDLDFSALGTAVLISPKDAFNQDTGMNWYANAGLTRLAFDQGNFRTAFGTFVGGRTYSSFELQVGGGVYMPIGPGTLYAGIDLIDEFIFGIGYRFGIQ